MKMCLRINDFREDGINDIIQGATRCIWGVKLMAVTPNVCKSKKTYRGLKEKIGGAMKILVRIKDESEMTRLRWPDFNQRWNPRWQGWDDQILIKNEIRDNKAERTKISIKNEIQDDDHIIRRGLSCVSCKGMMMKLFGALPGERERINDCGKEATSCYNQDVECDM